jgi:LPS export ABC transporter permease LptG
LGIRSHRGGKPAAVVLALAIILFYYFALTVGEDLSDRGYIWPWLAMWGPNLLVGAIGLLLFRQLLRERPFPGTELAGRLGLGLWEAIVRRFRRRGHRAGLRPILGPVASLLAGIQKVPLGYLVDRYLLRQFLLFVVYGLAVAACVFVVGDLLQTADRYMKFRPPLSVIGEHFLYRTPAALYQALPIVVLLSAMLLFVTLGRNNELTALKAGGVSLYRVSAPILLLSLLITAGAFLFQEGILPALNQRGEEVDRVKIRGVRLLHLRKQTQLWFRSGSQRIFHIHLLDPEAKEMLGVTVFDLSPAFALGRRVDAAVARWQGGAWQFEKGVTRTFSLRGTDRAEPFERRSLPLAESFEDFMEIQKAPALMSYRELAGYVRKLEEGGHQVGKYLVELYGKQAFPFVNIIMVIVGIPFALHAPRAGRVIGIALAILLAIGYWLTYSLALALARLEVLPPLAAAWAANIVFAGLGLSLFLRVRT